jgi:hypothetical protein
VLTNSLHLSDLEHFAYVREMKRCLYHRNFSVVDIVITNCTNFLIFHEHKSDNAYKHKCIRRQLFSAGHSIMLRIHPVSAFLTSSFCMSLRRMKIYDSRSISVRQKNERCCFFNREISVEWVVLLNGSHNCRVLL